jgi:4-diphosphocytidyl-2C-methyl-D-erythritol kinase
MPDRLTVHAHAKANLLLRVLSQEVSGYHGIETLFTLLELHDDIEVERTDRGIELVVEGDDTGPTESVFRCRLASAEVPATAPPRSMR